MKSSISMINSTSLFIALAVVAISSSWTRTTLAFTTTTTIPATRLLQRTTTAINNNNDGHMRCSSTKLYNANKRAADDELYRSDKSKRFADIDDNLVELKRPLGLVLDQNESGDVYVETVAPRGNAARTGKVKEGDILVMCSATFGDQMWSTRGAGLSRVMNAIKVRAGPTVKLVFESPTTSQRKLSQSKKAAEAQQQARQAAQAKRDSLLQEMEQDEKRLKKGKFLGLF